MRIRTTAIIGVTLSLFCICRQTPAQEETITVTGKLTRAMAIGGESTGWSIQFESEKNIDGKPRDSIEVASHRNKQLKALANKRVEATGKISHKQGVETGLRPILSISSIKELKEVVATLELTGTEWLLEDLAGSGVIDNIQATLAFPEAGGVTGRGSCNRFFGSVQITGSALKFGPLGSTRMACPQAVMNQEDKYLNALQSVDRYEWKAPYLLLHSRGLEKPLRFTRKPAAAH